MGYSLQRPRAPLDQLAKLPTNERSFNGLLTSTPTRTARSTRQTSDKRAKFQWATHFNALAHRCFGGNGKQRKYRFQWATHFNAHAHGTLPLPSINGHEIVGFDRL